tara:strand:+ start:28015 stop:28203 length:189 start_codon:yes stop_codon:yes gene_type:complete
MKHTHIRAVLQLPELTSLSRVASCRTIPIEPDKVHQAKQQAHCLSIYKKKDISFINVLKCFS